MRGFEDPLKFYLKWVLYFCGNFFMSSELFRVSVIFLMVFFSWAVGRREPKSRINFLPIKKIFGVTSLSITRTIINPFGVGLISINKIKMK